MSAVPKRKLTVEEYFAIEEKAEYKSEFYRGEMFAMAGATRSHNRVKDNMMLRLGMALLDGPCRVASSDTRVLISKTGLYTYPDASVICGEADYANEKNETITNPTLIVEVLSKSTENYDRGRKFEHYQSIDSLKEYLLFSQDRMRIERYVRESDGGWKLTAFADPDGFLELGSLPVKIAMKDIYAGVKLEPERAEELRAHSE